MFCPFIIERSEEFGRYLTSTHAFDVGDMLWEESALVSAPDFRSDISIGTELKFPCVGCYKNLDDASKICTECGWPCCSERCSESAMHKKFECKMFARLRTKATAMNFSKLIYLRLFLCKQVDPPNHEQFEDLCFEFYENDEDHEMKCEQEIMAVWKFLTQECQLSASVEDVTRLWNPFKINNFGFNQADHGAEYSGHGAYYYGSLMSHSCSPSVEFSFFKSVDANGDIDWKMQMFARKEIDAGDVLTIAYNSFELKFGTVPRQRRIFNKRRFTCMCTRCQDNTEGGTYFQALLCQKCEKGILLPIEAIEIEVSPWKCDICHHMEEPSSVRQLVDMLKPLPYSLLNKTPDEHSVLKADAFMKEKEHLLHPNHYLMFQCGMHWLLGSNFTVSLMSTEKEAKALFTKILTRAKRYLPLCMDFMPCHTICMVLLVIAKAYAAFVFKSSDMQTFVDGDDPLGFKLRICRTIVAVLNENLKWRKLKAGNYNREMALTFYWFQHAQKFVGEIEKQENMALESIRYLFSEQFGI